MITSNNKRIAKNTLLLYFRMLLIIVVSLYTSRVILNTLGISDFGIYNVVGGIVTMFAFLNSAMASGTQRFLSFELGRKDYEQFKKVFNMSVNIHIIIAIVILIFAETIGLWFLNTKLVIPLNRIEAANWVYQFSILSFIITILSVPYNATIIAYERMNIFAIVSIIEVTLKLIIVFSLVWFGYDKLKLYAVLMFCITCILLVIYKFYCNKNFNETHYSFFWDINLFKVLMNYTGWNLFGNIAGVAMGQGINILLNLFFGPVVNAARGIAFQVNGAVNGFVSNFQMAMNPQIVKAYATNDKKYMHQLIFKGSKYAYFLLYFITLPIILETETILSWWLKIVPEHSSLFCKLILTNALIDSISGPLGNAALATGQIKKYQIIIGGLQIIILPISYYFLKIGYPPQTTLFISVIISIIALLGRLYIISPLVELSVIDFTKKVLIPITLVTISSFILPNLVLQITNQGFCSFLFVCIISFFSVIISIYFLGLKKQEKHYIQKETKQYLIKTILNHNENSNKK